MEIKDPLDPFPGIAELVTTKPEDWLGKRLRWSEKEMPIPERLTSLPLPDSRTVHLFATRHDLADVSVDGRSYAPWYFEEYFAVTGEPSCWRVHRLRQRGRSVTYSASFESGDSQRAEQALRLIGSGGRLPEWKASDAAWPLLGGRVMSFVGQVSLERQTSPTTPSGVTVYLFWCETAGEDAFKVVTQESHIQTADEHYRQEEEEFRRSARISPEEN